ncbi:MAG: hypothetical protein ACREBE_09900, partial [bacterium]
VWVWLERIHPRKARVPQPKVIAVRTASLDDKEFLLALDKKKFFTEPHYAGFPAVLVRLDEVTSADLKVIIAEAWRCLAPKELLGESAMKAKPAKKAAKKGAKKAAKRSASPRGSKG